MKTPREFLLNRHRSVESKLDRIWTQKTRAGSADGTGFPSSQLAHRHWLEALGRVGSADRRIWAGLACAWVVIAVLNLASSEPATQIASNTKPPSHEEVRALIEQRQLLAQLIGPMLQPSESHRRYSPGPRSERHERIATA